MLLYSTCTYMYMYMYNYTCTCTCTITHVHVLITCLTGTVYCYCMYILYHAFTFCSYNTSQIVVTVQVIKKFLFQITLRLRYNLITIVKQQRVHRFTIVDTENFTLRQPVTSARAANFKGHAQNMHVTRVKSLYAVVGNKRKRLAQLQ